MELRWIMEVWLRCTDDSRHSILQKRQLKHHNMTSHHHMSRFEQYEHNDNFIMTLCKLHRN